MSSQSLSKKLLVSAVVALPFPYVMLVLASAASVLPEGLRAESFLSGDNATGFYAIVWFMFLLQHLSLKLQANLVHLLLLRHLKSLIKLKMMIRQKAVSLVPLSGLT